MSRLILHVGTHKTGTTALQEFLLQNDSLLSQAGIAFPQMPAHVAGVKPGRNGNFLRWHAFTTTRPDSVTDERREQTALNVDAFLNAAQSAPTVILSEEYLWYDGAQDPRYWDVLSELFQLAGCERVDVVVYLRRQDLFVASLWNQKVKDITKIRGTLQAYARRPAPVNAMDYDAVIRELERVFGKEHITVRVFDRAELEDGDIRRDFCSLAGIELTPDFSFCAEPANPGLTASAAEVKRQANYVPEYRDTDNFLRDPAVSVAALRFAKGQAAAPKLPFELAQALLERHAEGNARIAREYLHREDGVLFRPLSEEPSGDSPGSGSGKDLLQEAIRFFTAALAQEHTARLDLEERVRSLEQDVHQMQKRAGLLAKIKRRLG